MHPNLPYWLAALHMSGIGPRKWYQWLNYFPDIQSLLTSTKEKLQELRIADQYIATLQTPNWHAVEKDLSWAKAEDHHIICYEDDAYPLLLKEISDPPLLLYARGNKDALKAHQLAIVGSRHATAWGLKNAEYFAATLSKRGIAITSGLALGIDGAAHHGALSSDGITIAVLGNGLQHIYPSSHRKLVNNMIAKCGLIISEFQLNTLPLAMNFPRRNRIIAGLSLGVLVVEAAMKSGSLITARFALEEGREVFAIPGSIHYPQTKGCHYLIRQGAKLVETAEDILEELQAYAEPLAKRPETAGAGPPHQSFLDQIDYETTPVDVIISRSGLTAGQVSSILLTLELEGYIQTVTGGYIRVIK